MNRMGRWIGIIFGCCVLLTIVFVLQSRPKKTIEVNSQKTTSAPKEITFRSTAIFDGRAEDGSRFVSYHYKASDCVLIGHQTTFFKSPAVAHRELEKEIKRASQVIERAPLMNDAGQQIGERVLVQSSTGEQNKSATEVIWTDNSELHSIGSQSAEHLLEFEKALRSRSERILSGVSSVAQVTFDELESHEGKSEEGIAYTEKKFRSSDCEFIKLRVEQFPSPELAQQQLETMLAQSTNVMERGPKLDAQGQKTGERAVAMFKAPRPSEYIEDTTIVWTSNSELYSLTGVYAYVVVFEQRNYR